MTLVSTLWTSLSGRGTVEELEVQDQTDIRAKVGT